MNITWHFHNAILRFRNVPGQERMLIRYACKDMGLSCPFVVKGETLEEVTQKALEHIRESHTNDFNAITSPAQIEEMRRALARSTRVVAG